jgi:hypothetical protein
LIQPGSSACSFARLDYRAQISIVAVADILKRYAVALGLDATEFASRSLRSGLATSAAAAGASGRVFVQGKRRGGGWALVLYPFGCSDGQPAHRQVVWQVVNPIRLLGRTNLFAKGIVRRYQIESRDRRGTSSAVNRTSRSGGFPAYSCSSGAVANRQISYVKAVRRIEAFPQSMRLFSVE